MFPLTAEITLRHKTLSHFTYHIICRWQIITQRDTLQLNIFDEFSITTKMKSVIYSNRKYLFVSLSFSWRVKKDTKIANQRRFIFSIAQLLINKWFCWRRGKAGFTARSSNEFVKKSTEGGNAIWKSFKALPGTIVLNYGKEKK